MEINITKFQDFCKRNFFLDKKIEQLRDTREAHKISAGTIFLVIFFCIGILRNRSLHGADQFVRMNMGKWLFKTPKPVVSDSTMLRSLEGYDLEKLRDMLESLYLLGRRSGQYKYSLSNGEKIKVGVVDGTNFGRLMASCFQQIGEVPIMLDLEVIEKRGKELPVSESLVKKLKERYGKRFVDLIMGDGLYMASGFINVCKEECGIDVLVKTTEIDLNIVKSALSLFACAREYKEKFPQVEILEGCDTQRNCSYKIFCAKGFKHKGIDRELKIAWVEEFYFKKKRQENFSVITTMLDLKALDMRELGHRRWSIENNGFKELNEQCDTKRIFSHQETAQCAVILILFIAFNLFKLFTAKMDYEKNIRPVYGGVRPTKRFFVMMLLDIPVVFTEG